MEALAVTNLGERQITNALSDHCGPGNSRRRSLGRLTGYPDITRQGGDNVRVAGAGAAAGIVTDGSNGTAVAPARVSTATEPMPALSIQIAGPTETLQGLINVGSVTVAFTVAPSEMMFVCTYVPLVCAKDPIDKTPVRTTSTTG